MNCFEGWLVWFLDWIEDWFLVVIVECVMLVMVFLYWLNFWNGYDWYCRRIFWLGEMKFCVLFGIKSFVFNWELLGMIFIKVCLGIVFLLILICKFVMVFDFGVGIRICCLDFVLVNCWFKVVMVWFNVVNFVLSVSGNVFSFVFKWYCFWWVWVVFCFKMFSCVNCESYWFLICFICCLVIIFCFFKGNNCLRVFVVSLICLIWILILWVWMFCVFLRVFMWFVSECIELVFIFIFRLCFVIMLVCCFFMFFVMVFWVVFNVWFCNLVERINNGLLFVIILLLWILILVIMFCWGV